MKNIDRAKAIQLLTQSLLESVEAYEEAKANSPSGYISAGCEVSHHDSKGSIKRQITLLRSELLELAKHYEV
jgi:hypothetical protein